MKEFFVKNKYLFFILLFIILNIFVSYFYIGYKPQLEKDAAEYGRAAEFLLQGGQVSKEVLMNRVLTAPLFIYSSILANFFFKDFSLSFSAVNVFFYFLCILAFYFLALEIYKEKKVAFWGSILVVFNYYVIDPNNAHLADMSGWFFLIVSTYLAIRYINTFSRKFYYLSVLSAAAGVLFKEYGGLGLVNLILLVLVSDLPKKQKIKDALIAGSLFIIPLFSYHIFAYFEYHISYLAKFLFVKTASSVSGYQASGFVLLIKILGWLFSFGWLAFLFGVKEELKIKDSKRLKILLAILPSTLAFLIWPAITQRLAVVFMFWLSLIAGFGLSRIKWYLLYPFLGIYIWFNYNIKFLIDKINLPF